MTSRPSRFSRLSELAGETVLADEPLAPYTTYRLGGRADFMVIPRNDRAISGIIRFCHEEELPLHILGRGSNLLIADEGIRGVVINMAAAPRRITVSEDRVEISAGSSLAGLLGSAYSHSLGGLEELVAIPGTIGGAVITNAGACGVSFLDRAERISLINRQGEQVLLEGDIPSQYRSSPLRNEEIVTGVTLKLEERKPDEIREKMKALALQRRAKIPYREKQAGSVFKNPPGDYAGRLIEQAGLKGKRCGGARISSQHANFIVNEGASSAEVTALIEIVRERVWKRSGVKLELELHLWT
ncbi:MAG: UDP-N-acetylmuramate dehydrogenase [bacterium]